MADELDVPQHVLRFWESKFTQVRPLKRGGGRRYYRPEDVELLQEMVQAAVNEGLRAAQDLAGSKMGDATGGLGGGLGGLLG